MAKRPPRKERHKRIRRFWTRVIRILRWYSRHSLVCQLRLLYREGFYLGGMFVILPLLTWLVLKYPGGCLPWIVGLLALAYIADSLLVNTWITFVSKSPAVPLRSILLTLTNIANIALAFGVLYALQASNFKGPVTASRAIYFSVGTITTVGYGDIVPIHYLAKITVILELAVGLYLLAAVLSMVVQWNQRGRASKRHRNIKS